MSNGAGYRLEDLVPFTAEVYFRLFERVGEGVWPLHLLTLALGVAAVSLALTDRGRAACLLLAPAWGCVGSVFFLKYYAELHWAGHYLGWAFFAQAALLAGIAVTGWGIARSARAWNPSVIIGSLIAAFGLVGYPLIAPLAGHGWHPAEIFGIHPDPTAVVTLGLMLIAPRGIALWTAAIIPGLWIAFSALTLLALDAPWSIPLFVVLPLAASGLVWKSGVKKITSYYG